MFSPVNYCQYLVRILKHNDVQALLTIKNESFKIWNKLK
ncbi:hypothetical protein SLVCU148_0026 [Staphylococcus lugdunensis VCU148]|nr:hypothetical protein SLGD_00892 [Staphylococcus lugdunensis HKU09-01]KAK63125.1 hypothetical protein SLVCU148_0026 [Staphylococcus lugdunensis VCU148]CCB53400.1 hypothetical protein SLUG_09350 [Staphylococcus lugdunensis N920143]